MRQFFTEQGIVSKILLPLTILLGLAIRLQHFNEVFRGGLVLFNGFDSYYHVRIAEIIVKTGHRIRFDSYLNYPYGLKVTWLPLYQWIISIPGLMFGFDVTEVFAALLPVLMGLIAILVVYLIAMESFTNRYVAIISAFLAALAPKLVSIHSVGNSDYHGWNVTIFLLSLLFFLRGIGIKRVRKDAMDISKVNSIGMDGESEVDVARTEKEWKRKNELDFLLSGVFLAILSATWLGGSIYASIIALITAIAVRCDEIDTKGIVSVFLPPVVVSSLVSVSSNFSALQLAFPYLAMLIFSMLVWVANQIADKKAILAEIQESDGEEDKIRAKKVKRAKKEKREKGEKSSELDEVRLRYRNVATVLTVILGVVVVVVLYVSSFRIVRFGIDYILGVSPYLPTIAEARSFQILLVTLETGMLAFLIAIPASIYHALKRERASLYLFPWLLLSFLLSMLQMRFCGVFVPVAVIYASYGICYLLQASNIPVLEAKLDILEDSETEEGIGKRKRGKKKKKKEREKEKRKKEKPEKLIWGRTEIAYSLVIILFISSTGVVFSFTKFDLSDDWLSTLLELKEISPPTTGYLNPVKRPEYSILSWWDYGNWILYIAKRPVVCNNFQAGAIDAARFFTTNNETLAKEILKERGVRYIITDDAMMLGNETFKGKFKAIMRIAGLDTRNSTYVLHTYNNSMFYRLHIGNGIDGIKLLSRHGGVKVFKVVSE